MIPHSLIKKTINIINKLYLTQVIMSRVWEGSESQFGEFVINILVCIILQSENMQNIYNNNNNKNK